MTKKQRVKRQREHVPARQVIRVPGAVVEAAKLTEQRRFVEARDLLLSALPRYPTNVTLLTELLNASYDSRDMSTYELAAERLLKLTPEDPALTLGLAGAYLSNLRPALAHRTFQRFLKRWPDHPQAAEARKTSAEMAEIVRDNMAHEGIASEDALEVAALNEESASLMEHDDQFGARRVAEALLLRHPAFVPALNNLSQIHYLEGYLDRAIATARRALETEPGNFHALGNLVHFQLLAGQPDEAKQDAEQLKSVESERPDLWVKTAEALGKLGDDAGVLATYARASNALHADLKLVHPLFFHLVAVAALRLGREDEARQHWKRALEIDPSLGVARDNLADLAKPAGERNGPWPLPLSSWLPQRWLSDLQAAFARGAERGGEQATKATVRRYLRDRPEVVNLLLILLDRGDPKGRQLAVQLATLAETPELLAALRDFALSQRGSDDLRLRAAQVAVEHGLLPSGAIQVWQDGGWHEVMLFGFEIVGEVTAKHSPAARPLVEDALGALAKGKADRGEALLKRALEIEPGAPDLEYNLAAAYQAQGRHDEFVDLLRRIHERHPDYLFARTALAQLAIQSKHYDEANELLKPLLSRQKLHVSEFGSICNAYVGLLAGEGDKGAARSWLALWRKASPDNPILQDWERRLGGSSGMLERLGLQGARRGPWAKA